MATAAEQRVAALSGSSQALSISVALCTYRGTRYLEEQLASLLTQTRLPDEVVAFDDASGDDTLAVLTDFERRATELGIRVLVRSHPTNIGYVRNFASALLATQCELVFLCDQDDVWHPGKLSRFADEFARRPDLLMLHSDADLVDGNGASLQNTLFRAFELTRMEFDAIHAGEAFAVLVKRNVATGATMAIRRCVIAHGFEVPPGWIHDEWLAMVAATQGRVDCLETSTIDYRQHDNNQVGARSRGLLERLTGGGISRADFMARMTLRTQSLMDQATAGNVHLNGAEMELLSERLKHARMRANLPVDTFTRARAVLDEYASGRYVRFSNGVRSALSDLSKIRG